MENDLKLMKKLGPCFPMVDITEKEFDLLRTLIYQNFGINLTYQKRVLLVCRLQKDLICKGFKTFHEYYDHIISDRSGQGLIDLVNRVSTNMTYFNREKPHFDFFWETALPEITKRLKEEGNNDIRIWSAGCSTGEEPFMLAIQMHEFFGRDYAKWDAGVLVSDISNKTSEIAQRGVY